MQYKDYPVGTQTRINPQETIEPGINAAEMRRAKLLDSAGFKPEMMEIRDGQFSITGFPLPEKRYFLILQGDTLNIEHYYYWLVSHAINDFNLPYSIKVTDSTAASVSSSSFGDLQARLGAQQGSVTNYMATVGRMTKDLFGLVRELRQIKERLGYYKEADLKKNDSVADVAEKTLKGIWIDLVEGGSQNPSSVIGLAQKVGFTILPDLFFSAPPMTEDQVKTFVRGDGKKNKGLDFNDQVLNMLERKLYQFIRWKIETRKELEAKKNFQIRYLRHHFDTIRMYLAWLRPYLRHVEMLSLDENKMTSDPWLVSAFQSQIIELETLVYGNPVGNIYPVVSFHFYHRTSPSLDYHAKEAWQQKGPIHMGRTEVVVRIYGWSQAELDKYIKMRKKEDFSLLESVDSSLKDAMWLMGDEVHDFLKEAEEELPDYYRPPKKKEESSRTKDKRESIYTPFVDIGKGMGDILKAFSPVDFSLTNPFSNKAAQKEMEANEKEKKSRATASKIADIAGFNAYKNYKKAHGHFQW